ncbi:MAG: uracil-DNA glycosylase [Flavobacterium sp.]|jgi:uracil-DNA glycosylase
MITSPNIKLHASWLAHIEAEFTRDYMLSLKQFLQDEKRCNKIIYPQDNEIFNALNATPLKKVKVVILGQDPYHGPGQAHGLCFSVKPGVKVPPSLVNVFKEIRGDLGVDVAALQNGCLTSWADQGVLLLNSVLTVEMAMAASHQGKGWEIFTDKIIDVVNQEAHNCVFMLWGAYAQKKGRLINREKHLVLEAPHPSPLSAYRGFLGCKHFSKCNQYLASKRVKGIDWRTQIGGDSHVFTHHSLIVSPGR